MTTFIGRDSELDSIHEFVDGGGRGLILVLGPA